ncbi:MAG: TetR/AcrR family transcriptional regulator [Methanosphaera sp.]|nr:TetR/AcrR family transcriptional regulator [Methanosphaera sp.]
MRVVKKPDERKKEIINGAIKVFIRKGYEKTTITDIANELDISQGLCYRYFDSKEDIYDACLDEYSTYIINSNLEVFNDNNLSFKEKITNLSKFIAEYKQQEHDNEEMYKLFHNPNNQKMHEELMIKIASQLIPYIKDELKTAKENCEIKITDTDAFAYFFVYGQIGMLIDKKETIDTATRIQDLLLELLDL